MLKFTSGRGKCRLIKESVSTIRLANKFLNVEKIYCELMIYTFFREQYSGL